MIVANASGHKHNVNGILDLLCREHFPSIVDYGGLTGLVYSFDHHAVGPDAVDQDARRFNNKAERVKGELWVSLPLTILFNTSHSLHILQTMNGYILFVCRILTNAGLDMMVGRMWGFYVLQEA
jgi:hypothetical protein